MQNRKDWTEEKKIKVRKYVHLAITTTLMLVIVIFKAINNQAVIAQLFTIAGYTYGPLLGMYSFGLFTKYKIKDKLIPIIVIASPVICYFLNMYSEQLLWGYKFGFELLIVNGMITFLGMLAIRKRD